MATKRVFILGLLIFTSFIANSQKAFVFSGKVMDSKNIPIPYCPIYITNLNIGTSTDTNGIFSVKIPQGFQDTAQISMLGYKKHIRYFSSDNNYINCIINLTDSVYSLNEVIVKPRKYKTYLPVKSKPVRVKDFYTTIGEISEVAQLFFNQISETSYLKGIYFYRSQFEQGQSRTYFRLKVYKANEDKSPSSTMLNNKDIIAFTEQNGYNLINLSDFMILIPKGYFYLSIEWLKIKGNEDTRSINQEWKNNLTGELATLKTNVFKPYLGQKEINHIKPVIYSKNFKGIWSLMDTKGMMFTFFPLLAY